MTLTVALSALFAAPASAHDTLTGSSPKKDATVEAPPEIELTFSAPVRLPRVVVTDTAEKRFLTGAPEAVDNKVTVALNGTMPNGEYTVAWRVVSSDGHPIQGTYKFTVEGAPAGSAAPSSAPSSAAAEPPAPAPTATNAASSEDSGGSSGWLWIGLIALVIGAAAGAIAWLRRSTASEN
ncbi:copper resistance protein CopC [Actinomadura sp. 6K520]|nr:copper resistance protein CopC [Actinomadura sp. 6K520]